MSKNVDIAIFGFKKHDNEGSLLTVGVGPFELHLFHTRVTETEGDSQ